VQILSKESDRAEPGGALLLYSLNNKTATGIGNAGKGQGRVSVVQFHSFQKLGGGGTFIGVGISKDSPLLRNEYGRRQHRRGKSEQMEVHKEAGI
jgi:hypothetical protein